MSALFLALMQDVYLPVMPYSLVDYLEAPTAFLMGLHADVALPGTALDGIVVVNLDSDTVSGGQVLQVCGAAGLLALFLCRVPVRCS